MMAASSGRLLLQFQPSSSTSAFAKTFLGFLPTSRVGIHVEKRKHAEMRYPVAKASLTMGTGGAISLENLRLVKEAGERILGLSPLVTDMGRSALKILQASVPDRRNWAAQIQMFIETGIMNCRFFTLMAVAGSLIGSILCFMEGCFLILRSFFEYYRTTSLHVDDGEVMQFLIEATGMNLCGTGMLNFGLGMYIIFVGSRGMKRCKETQPGSVLSEQLHRLILHPSMERQWLSQAKAKLGHAVLMILQAETVVKFKMVPMATGFDMACFAGAVLMSSATLFVLSRLVHTPAKSEEEQGLSVA